jgi:hypothetical protein
MPVNTPPGRQSPAASGPPSERLPERSRSKSELGWIAAVSVCCVAVVVVGLVGLAGSSRSGGGTVGLVALVAGGGGLGLVVGQVVLDRRER